MSRRDLWKEHVFPILCVALTGFAIECPLVAISFYGGLCFNSFALGVFLFAPPAALSPFADHYDWLFVIIYFGFPLLYPAYGIAIAIGRRFRCGMRTLLCILAFHYTSAAAAFFKIPVNAGWESVPAANPFLRADGWLWVASAIGCVAFLHWLAFWYASREYPRSPRLKKNISLESPART